MSIDGIKVKTADNIKYVGMWLYASLSMEITSGNSVQQGV